MPALGFGAPKGARPMSRLLRAASGVGPFCVKAGQRWNAKSAVDKSYVYAKLLLLQGTLGYAIVWNLYPLMRTS
jgi:hypothetical protein